MNTTPMTKITEEGPEADYATVRRLLQLGLDSEEPNEDGETPDLARKRAIKANTGASEFLPPKVVPVELPLQEPPPPAEGLITDGQHRGD